MSRLKALVLALFIAGASYATGDVPLSAWAGHNVDIQDNLHQKIWDSSVMVFSHNFSSHGSGNYVKFRGELYVITAKHVVDDDDDGNITDGLKITVGKGHYVTEASVVWAHPKYDVAVLRVDSAIDGATPIRLRMGDAEVGDETVYVGYPNSHGRMLIEGKVTQPVNDPPFAVGFFMDSYAWGGASGSLVFNSDGEAIGVLVGMDAYGFSILENIVLFQPISFIDWAAV